LAGGTILEIKKFREALHMTPGQLAEKVGVSRIAVYKWEIGENQPSADKLPALADSLGVTIDALFGRDGPKAG
jgi:transcriptional regulator with XRE-family HTH domain